MLTLPDAILPVLHPFATLFRSPTWLKAQILLAGAILAPGQRTVAAARRVMGRSDHLGYARYHEVLNRAVWSPCQAARILLMLLLKHLDQGDGPLVFGIDETLERRRGPKIKSLGIYRDAVRSSRSHLVKASGLRWVSLMWLGHVPWAGRYWALPFLTVLAPSERCYRQRGRRHKKLTDWARQMIVQLRRRPRTPPDLAGRQAEDRSLGIGHHPRGADCQQVPHGVGAQVEDRSPFPVSSPLPFLSAPIRHLGENVGAIYVGVKDREFTPEDEETLVMFASQAALVIANARRWVLLFRERFSVSKPLSQMRRSTFLPLQDADPTPSFGGFRLKGNLSTNTVVLGIAGRRCLWARTGVSSSLG